MKRSLLLLAVLLAGLRPGLSPAATTPRGLVVDDLTVAPPDGWWRTGAMLLRAEVRNPTPSEQRVRIRYGDGNAGQNDAFADLVVPAGGRSLCELPLPRANHMGRDRLYAIDASGKETPVSDRSPSFRSWSNGFEPALYVSRSLSGERLRDELVRTAESLKSTGRFGTGSRYGEDFTPRAARAGDFADPWPGDWRAYSVFAGVFVADRDLPDLPASAKAALRDYAAAGGCVFLVGSAEIPAEFASAALVGLAVPSSPATGIDDIPATSPDGAAPPRPLPALRCGLGLVAAVPPYVAATGSPAPIPEPIGAFLLRHLLRAQSVLDTPQEVARLLADAGGSASDGLSPPPVLSFLLILLAFSVLAGPVSLWLLARRNRRIHILWVLPALSAVFSVAIVLSLLLREGVTPTLSVRTGVLLDQRAGRAYAVESDAIYSPLSVGGIDLPADAAVQPVAPHGSGAIRVGRAARYEGWISPRTPGAFLLSSVRATPLRLDIREDPATGDVEAVNAFGAPVESLLLLDDAGELRAAADLAPGASVRLERADAAARTAFAAHSASLSTALRYGRVPLGQDVLSRSVFASRRFYVAVLPAAPFSSDPLPGRKAKRSGKTIVYGVY